MNNYKDSNSCLWVSKRWIQLLLLLFIFSCTGLGVDDLGYPEFDKRFEIFFNNPTGSDSNSFNIESKLIRLLDEAEFTIDAAFYTFNNNGVIHAFLRAKKRGVMVRFVGDVDERENPGYQELEEADITRTLGNVSGIMHHKFIIVDKKFLFGGTGNITDNGFFRNDNNFFIIESSQLVEHFQYEFDQLFYGRFATAKVPGDNRQKFKVNGILIEDFFSPYEGEQAFSRMISLIENAKHSIHFMIYAFTHDELATAFIEAAGRGLEVKGVIDKTFIKGISSEGPRLFSSTISPYGPYLHRDGNENTEKVGDSRSGGKLHVKTLIIDKGFSYAKVITGSFNWSYNSINKNDENLLIFHSNRIAEVLFKQWQKVWQISRSPAISGIFIQGDSIGSEFILAKQDDCREKILREKDVIINEIHWAGSRDANAANTKDQMVELRNLTNCDINITHWNLEWTDEAGNRKIWHVPDSSNSILSEQNAIIPAGGFFVIKNLSQKAFASSGGVKISAAKNFYLLDGSFRLLLRDKKMKIMDIAGNGGLAPAGEKDSEALLYGLYYSMERKPPRRRGQDPLYDVNWQIINLFALPDWDGALADNWCTSVGDGSGTAGGGFVEEEYKPVVIATPLEKNSCE